MIYRYLPEGSAPRTLRVTEGIPQLLRDLIHERTGLFFEDGRMDCLIEKLEPGAQARGFHSLLDYYYALKENARGEWDQAWEALSVQETYFWREMAQIKTLVEVVIPNWFRKHTQPFRIWSAACATGEEPYTITMALAEAGMDALPVEIVATDASLSALEKARRGVYRDNSFRTLPEDLRNKYFERVPEGWKISEELKARVAFDRVNLFHPGEIARFARVPAIFCRNVFIYFSHHTIRQTVAMIAAKMPPGGYLFVGASESLLRMTTDFELKEIAGALVYVRM